MTKSDVQKSIRRLAGFVTRQAYNSSDPVIYHFLRDLAPQPGKAIVTKSAPNYVEDPAKSDAYPQQKISLGEIQVAAVDEGF